MDFKYMDLSPYAKDKVFFCSAEFMELLYRVTGQAVGSMQLQEGTHIKFWVHPAFPYHMLEGETIHGIMMATSLGDIDPVDFIPAEHVPKENREIWTFKI